MSLETEKAAIAWARDAVLFEIRWLREKCSWIGSPSARLARPNVDTKLAKQNPTAWAHVQRFLRAAERGVDIAAISAEAKPEGREIRRTSSPTRSTRKAGKGVSRSQKR